MERPVPMGTSRGFQLTCALCLSAASLVAQTSTGKTVRHRQVQVEDQSQPAELTKAEALIEKKDFVAAEPLLKKLVAAQPNNYQAWFDLGFVYNALERPDDSVAAYRES